MPFRFSLQEVLDYRKRIEELRQREMQEIQRQVNHVEDLIGQARHLRGNYARELSERTAKGMSLAYQEIYRNYIAALDGLIRRSEEHLAQLRRELERRRLLLVQAVQQREVMDELKKQEARQYAIDERRQEQKQFDEIAIRDFLISSQEKTAGSLER